MNISITISRKLDGGESKVFIYFTLESHTAYVKLVSHLQLDPSIPLHFVVLATPLLSPLICLLRDIVNSIPIDKNLMKSYKKIELVALGE